MWITTKIGFFSIVQKPGDETDDMLTVRARVEGDLARLLAEVDRDDRPEIKGAVGTDYPYRVRLPRSVVAVVMLRLAAGITYANFKTEVALAQGEDRAAVYSKVWLNLITLEDRHRELSRTIAFDDLDELGYDLDPEDWPDEDTCDFVELLARRAEGK